MKFLLPNLLTIYLLSASNWLINGDFEQVLSNGWKSKFFNYVLSDTIDRQTYFHPDSDYEARVKKYDSAYAMLYQVIPAPTVDFEFLADAKLYAYEFNPAASYWAAAALVISYTDSLENTLGETRIVYKSLHCPWVDTPNIHHIWVLDTLWNSYSLNIGEELMNLPGINPASIRKIRISLYSRTTGC